MFRQARWDEPIIFEMGHPGRRGHIVLQVEEEIEQIVGSVATILPQELQRKSAPRLPELSEAEIVRHFTRLSQMNYCVDLGLYPLGSCTMKYNPKIDELLAGSTSITGIHPYQDERTAQGILEILYKLSQWLAEITGTHEVCLQPAAGAQGEFLGALMMRAYHEENGQLEERTELIVEVWPDSRLWLFPLMRTVALI
jgi:glycine dehydrogenase subunit 2